MQEIKKYVGWGAACESGPKCSQPSVQELKGSTEARKTQDMTDRPRIELREKPWLADDLKVAAPRRRETYNRWNAFTAPAQYKTWSRLPADV